LEACYGSTVVGNTRYINYALDIDNGVNANNVNLHLWSFAGGNTQRVAFERTSKGRYKIMTKCSNWTKNVVLQGPTYGNHGNIIQYQYYGNENEEWIMEPVNKDWSLGYSYAITNHDNYNNGAYPSVRYIGGDCANFVSQCLLNSGIHYQDKWWIYRKNANYNEPVSSSQLSNSWNYDVYSGGSSPWISAHYFKEYWYDIPKTDPVYCTGSFIIQNPNVISNLSHWVGDVIQICDPYNNNPGSAFHTLYITNMNYDYSGGYYYYTVTSHSGMPKDTSLFDYANSYPNKYFVFYKFI